MAETTASEWIAKRRELTTEATVGTWEWLAYGGGMQLVRRNAPYHDHNILKTTDDWPPCTQDAAFIADARVSLPLALDALEALLKGHRPVSFSFSWRDGVTMHEVCETCQDKAGVHPCGCWRDEDVPHVCAVCSDPEHRMDAPWPCMTVQAIESALRADA